MVDKTSIGMPFGTW